MLWCSELVVALLARGQPEHRFFGLLVIVAMNFQDLEEQRLLLEHIPLLCNA